MRRQLPPTHIKVAGPTSHPPQRFLGDSSTVVVNHYTNADKLIPAIPGFKTSAGEFFFNMLQNFILVVCLFWGQNKQLKADHTKLIEYNFGAMDGDGHNDISSHSKKIPFKKTNQKLIAFLTSLSANLRIDPDLPSPLGTPNSFRGGNSHFPLPPPSPLHFSALSSSYNPRLPLAETEIMSTNPETHPQPVRGVTDELPTLSTYTAETEDDRIEGLRLIADSVAQQRQVASKMLVFHPLNIAVYIAVLGIFYQYLWKTPDDMLVFLTTAGGITMAYLVAIRMATGGYLGLAERINWEWLGDDRLVVVKWGEDIIGALVLGWADDEVRKKNARRRRGKAVVRAWTVKLKYRGKGVGEGLLEEAVKVAERGGRMGLCLKRDMLVSQITSFVSIIVVRVNGC